MFSNLVWQTQQIQWKCAYVFKKKWTMTTHGTTFGSVTKPTFIWLETSIRRTAGHGVVTLRMKSMSIQLTVLNLQHGALYHAVDQCTRDNWSTMVWRTWHDCYNYTETIPKDTELFLCFVARSARSAFWIAMVSAGRCDISHGEWDHEEAWRDVQLKDHIQEKRLRMVSTFSRHQSPRLFFSLEIM